MPYGDEQSYDVLSQIAAENGVEISPDVFKRLAEVGLLKEEIAMEMVNQKRSQEMMQGGMPQATPVGRTMVAPHPLQYAAAGMQQGMGAMGMMKSKNAIDALRRRQQEVTMNPGVYGGGGY